MATTSRTDLSHDLGGAPPPPRELDLLDPRFYDDPWDAYRWLRDHAPVFWDARNELWVLSRHEDVAAVSRDQDRYSAAEGVRPRVAAPMSIISMDDPEHTRQRRIVSKGFTPRKVRQLTGHIRDLSREIVDEIAERGECDFVEHFAIHVPLIVIAEMMGFDPDQRLQLYRWSDAMMRGDGHLDPESPQLRAAADAFAEFTAVCAGLIEQRRADPRDDIVGLLTGAFDAGELETDQQVDHVAGQEDLTDEELLMFLTLLVVAGNETTRNALSGGLVALTRFPGERDRLVADPDLWDLAVDEIVRYVSPVLNFCRTVTEDHTFRGVQMRAGEKVLLLYQSANRDERVFDEPDRLVVDRSPNPHLAFGVGTHYCMGANLAKAEIRTVFSELLARLPDIRRAGDDVPPRRGDSALVLSIEHLPAVFTPESRR